MKTDFTDRSGKPVYTGDIVQYRLGGLAKKSDGPRLYRVIKIKKGFRLTPAHAHLDSGWPVRKGMEKFLTIFDTKYRELD